MTRSSFPLSAGSEKKNSLAKICLGTAQFGLNYGINNSNGKPSLSSVYDMLDFAYDIGITHLDTADTYGDALEIIGGFQDHTRKDFDIHNKFTADGTPLKQKLERSLLKLNRSRLETYYFHSYDDFLKYPLYHNQIQRLREDNLIGSVGVSIYENREFESACDHDFIDVIQIPFNLLDNTRQRGELIEYAISRKKTVQSRSVFLQGLFFMDVEEFPKKLTPLLPYVYQLLDICSRAKITMSQLAMSYVLQVPGIDKIIVGVDSIEQLRQNIKLNEFLVPMEVIHEVDEIFVQESALLYPKNW